MKNLKPPKDGPPVPWQPCCDPGRRHAVYYAAKLTIWWYRRRAAGMVTTPEGQRS